MICALVRAVWGFFLHDPAAAITAVSTAVIGAYTIVLARVTGRQARLTREAIELGTREFVSTHPPRMRVRYVETTALASARHTATIFAAKAGDTDARVVANGVDIFVQGNSHSAVPVSRAPPDVVAPGQEMRFSVVGGQVLTGTELSQIGHRSLNLCLLGIIRYEDGNGTARNTSLYRVYDPTFSRFNSASINDASAEREYED